MAVRLTLLAAPLLGVTLVLLALLPPSSHVASASAAPSKTPTTTAPPSTAPRSLPCSGQTKAEGDAVRGKRDTKCIMVAATTNGNKRLTAEEEEGAHMSKRAVPEGSESLSAEKRAPSSSGFFGMRGKKGGEGEGGEAFKRAPSSSGFFGMRGKKEDLSEGADGIYYDPEDFEAADKRAPSSSGFFGMRGKKIPMLGYAPWYRDLKRARMGFFGTRGKKSGDEGDYYAGAEEYKRAPAMGFFGSRGKKWDEDGNLYGWDPEELEGAPGDKRAAQHMNFFGVRGKRNGGEAGDAGEYEKRAPNSGFFGMRGKKSPGVDGGETGEWGEEKRAPNSGFFGMRGKKDYADEDYEEVYGDAGSKRAPMGFFGMRGKKEYPGYWSEGGDKRAPMGFFGMRGKKDAGEGDLAYSEDQLEMPEEEKRAAQHLAFFGMRGKKSEEFAPADGWYLHPTEAKRGLAGAAVSAWPATSTGHSSINSLLAYLAGRDAAMTEGHTGSGWRPVRKRFRGNKKAPMGFIGMRGKKAESLSKEVWPPSSSTNGENGYEVDSKLQTGDDEEAAFQNQAVGDNSVSQ